MALTYLILLKFPREFFEASAAKMDEAGGLVDMNIEETVLAAFLPRLVGGKGFAAWLEEGSSEVRDNFRQYRLPPG